MTFLNYIETVSRIVKAVEWQMAKENLKLDAGEIKVFADRETEGAWRVEFFDDDGGCYVTVFSGPHAGEVGACLRLGAR
jgi:hypothetical protein